MINITGDLVMLGPMERSQIALYQRWLNNFETLYAQGEPVPMPDSLDSVTRWFEGHVLGRDDVAWFTVYEKSSGTPIGWAELKDIDYRHRTAEYAIMIGEESARGKGYGTEVTRLMLDYGFNVLGLHNIHLNYFAFNEPARRVYERAGFREYGRRKESHFMGGRLWDTVLMECLPPHRERTAPSQPSEDSA